MKIKKNKNFKKNLQFYRIFFNFHQPYQLVLDGNFIKVMTDNGIDLERQFLKLTKQKCWRHTTECVLRELKSLSHLFPRAYQVAQKLSKLNCKHIEGVSAAECLQDVVKQVPSQESANQFYWICTQDEELKTELHQIDHVPVCYLYQNNLLELIEPSRKSRVNVKQKSANKYQPNELEKKMIQPIKKQINKELVEKRMLKERKVVQSLGIKLRKPAKGANPLSMKKKALNLKIRKRRHKIKGKHRRRLQQEQQ
ncbi:hypothetical protein pb186bvf_015807 [Paramecium bursaria]